MYITNGSLGGDQFGVFTGLETKINAPEEWLLRKAYSPVRVENEYLNLTDSGNLSFRVQNRFFHTNLSEIQLQWKMGNNRGSIMCPPIALSQYGVITLPVEHAKLGDTVEFAFLRKDGFQVDEYALTIGAVPFDMPVFSHIAPLLSENEDVFIISGKKFKIEISKQTGQIVSGAYNDWKIITGGHNLILMELKSHSLTGIASQFLL